MVLPRIVCCLSCVVSVLGTQIHVRGRRPIESPQAISQLVRTETRSNQPQWTSTAACMKNTEGTCRSSAAGPFCEQRFGNTQCVDIHCICLTGMCTNTSGICAQLVSRQLGVHAIRSLNPACGTPPKFLGVEFGFKAFGPFWDPAWLKKGPDFYLATVDNPEPQWLVTDIGDGFVRLESTIAHGKVLSFAGFEGVQLRNLNTSKAVNIGFKVQGGPDAYELAYHQGLFIRVDSFRHLGQVTASWVIFALWLCLLLAIVGGTSCCFADFAMLRIPLVAFTFIWMLAELHAWVPAYGVSYCGGPWQCYDRQWIQFEPALEQSVVDRDGIWTRPQMIDVFQETLRWTLLPVLALVLVFIWCSVGIFVLHIISKAHDRQREQHGQQSPCALSAR